MFLGGGWGYKNNAGAFSVVLSAKKQIDFRQTEVF